MIYLKLHKDSVHLDSKAVPKSASPEKYLARCCFSLQQTLALQHLLLHNFSFFFLPSPLLFGSHPLLPLLSCELLQKLWYDAVLLLESSKYCFLLYVVQFSATLQFHWLHSSSVAAQKGGNGRRMWPPSTLGCISLTCYMFPDPVAVCDPRLCELGLVLIKQHLGEGEGWNSSAFERVFRWQLLSNRGWYWCLVLIFANFPLVF